MPSTSRKELVKGFDDYLKQKIEVKTSFDKEFEKYFQDVFSKISVNDVEISKDKISFYKQILDTYNTKEMPSFLLDSKNNLQEQNIIDMQDFSWYKHLLSKLGPEVENEFRDVYVKNSNIQTLGKEIKRLRELQGWSTAKLAELSQMSLGFINQLETGKASLPKASNLTKLAKIFCVNPDTFLCMAGYIKSEPEIEQDWRIFIKNKLSDIGLKGNYVDEIIDYIEVVQIKQERQEALEAKND